MKDKINTYLLNKIELLRKKIFSKLGYIVTARKINYYTQENGSYKFDYKKYSSFLYRFYRHEAKRICDELHLNYIEELLKRRKELKKQSAFISNVFTGFGVGVFTGLIMNNFGLLQFLFKPTLNESFINVIMNILSILLILFVAFFIPFIIIGLFKIFVLGTDPKLDYYQETELKIINNILEEKIGGASSNKRLQLRRYRSSVAKENSQR